MKPDRQINTAKENLLMAITEWAAVKRELITTKNLPDIVDWKQDDGTIIQIRNTMEAHQFEKYFTNQLRARYENTRWTSC